MSNKILHELTQVTLEYIFFLNWIYTNIGLGRRIFQASAIKLTESQQKMKLKITETVVG